MKTKDFRNLGLVLSLSMVRILNGLSAQKAKVLERVNFFHRVAEFFGGLYLSLEDFADLYFYLPENRRRELKDHLNFLAKDFVSWKKFFEVNRYSNKNIRDMALNEMIYCVNTFYEAYEGFRLSDDLIIKESFLKIMELKGSSFEEKLQVIRCSNGHDQAKIEELFLMIKTFTQAEQFSSIIGIDDRNLNKGTRKMLSLADDFKKVNRTHRRSIPGSLLRREIVAVAKNYELPQSELIQYYYDEKHWSNFKRMLFGKIERLVLGIEDWLEILLHYGSDRKLKNLAMFKMRQLGLTFYQLNNTLSRAMDPEIKNVILEEMFLLSKNSFEKLCIVSVKSDDFSSIFLRSFLALLELVSDEEKAEKACEILASSKNRNNPIFVSKIVDLRINFNSLDKLFAKSPKEGKLLLLPQMKMLAKNNLNDLLKIFNYYSVIDDTKERQRKQNICLKEVLFLLEEDNNVERLLAVYRTALISGNFSVSDKVVEIMKTKNFNFKTLLLVYEELEKNKITNNGLASYLQMEMIAKAENNLEKSTAFKKASLQIKSLALSRLLRAA
ncbi:MAG: hypothetical protein WCY43_02340 [Patescibacteria group bacterium]|nr:hypothetical protein [Patescibacteria group bacterium]